MHCWFLHLHNLPNIFLMDRKCAQFQMKLLNEVFESLEEVSLLISYQLKSLVSLYPGTLSYCAMDSKTSFAMLSVDRDKPNPLFYIYKPDLAATSVLLWA